MNSRNIIGWIIVFLLFTSVALAAPIDDADYVTVVAEADGAEGVMVAMNYAAAMQVHGYTFTGGLDTNIADVQKLNEKFLTFIEGKDVTIVDGLNSPDAAAQTVAYFEDLNYHVNVGTLSEMVPAWSKDTDDEEAIVTPPSAPESCTGCTFGTNCLATGTQTGTKYCDASGEMLSLKANGEACTEGYECFNQECSDGTCGHGTAEDAAVPPHPSEEEEKPRGFFATIFSWFAGLFGG